MLDSKMNYISKFKPEFRTGSVSITIYFGGNTFSKTHITDRLEPVLFPFDPYTEVVHLNYTDFSMCKPNGSFKQDDKLLHIPAIAIMLFAPERGPVNAQKLKANLLKPPWQLHHTVVLQKKSVAFRTVAQQDFYELSDDLPLWCVCPTLLDQEYLRIQLFVKNFRKMSEFYGLITNEEMINKKPGFCFFEMNSPSGQKIQLSLKYCSSIKPFQVRNAILSFRTREIIAIQSQFRLIKISFNVYTTLDPDGNTVRLIDDTNTSEQIRMQYHPLKLLSDKNHSDSQDSGLFSDCEKAKYSENKSYAMKTNSLKIKYTVESDFEDPWGGSQYNVSVNPEQRFKVIPQKASKTNQQDNQANGNGDSISQNLNKVKECHYCVFKERELSVPSDQSGRGLLTCRSTDYEKKTKRDETVDTVYEISKNALSGRYYILPDEGYNDTFTRNAPRSKSLDSASIGSFHKSKNRSVIQILSDKLLSKEKKFQWTSLNSVDFDQQGNNDKISKDIWYQNPKLFRVLGPPEVTHQPEVGVAAKKGGNHYFSDGDVVTKNSKVCKRKQLMCKAKLKACDKNLRTEKQIGSLVCISP